ncbi:MAG: trypsin-like peptidase domain-containing protein [Alicyclobacillaceae bacterium]|nr:trypsin-like peptidase domain-containing protein [Alicyclobacillaceae bacterium]
MQRRRSAVGSRQPKTSHVIPDFVPLIKRYQKAVYGIEVIQNEPTRGFPLFGPFNVQPDRPYRSVNIGTGFMIHPRGYIVTNEHVIQGASRVMLRPMNSKSSVPAYVVAADSEKDIAILRSRELKGPYTILSLTDDGEVDVGQWVIAMGSPLGLDNTVTVGIVSAKDRPLTIGSRKYESLIQTDAAINRGNSGGPLVDLNGRVVGMNTAVSQSSQGIGFAISANIIRKALKNLLPD